MGRKNRRFNIQYELMKDIAIWENLFTTKLLNIYASTYRWNGLPDSIDPRWLEMSLIKNGKVIFYKEYADIGLVVYPAQAGAHLNTRGYPTEWRAFGANGYTAMVPYSESEYCYNNYTAFADLPAIILFAKQLAYIEISRCSNVLMQRFPGMIRCTENERTTMENLLLKYFGGEPLIVADKDLGLDGFEHIDFKVPYVADKLEYSKRDTLMEALNHIGIQYSASNKAERLASTEIDSNIGYCEANRVAHLTPRKECAERLNKRWGLNVTVDINEDLVNMLKIADVNPNSQQRLKTLYGSSSGEQQEVTT